ncbi:MAG TPA: hypothetical protein VGH52_10930 [Gaiellaceae bacterium]|jgi:hypothetical protein
MKALVLLVALAVLAAGCGSTKKSAPPAKAKAPVCAHLAGWQKLANQIHAPVYCPGWLPDPLTGQLGAVDNNLHSVSKDRSYLESWIWQDTDTPGLSGVLHVNLRGYPGVHGVPNCTTGGTKTENRVVKCFANRVGTFSANGIDATIDTVNQDADEWHIAMVWKANGGFYTLSEHVAAPLTPNQVTAYLKRELRNLVLIRPASAAT